MKQKKLEKKLRNEIDLRLDGLHDPDKDSAGMMTELNSITETYSVVKKDSGLLEGMSLDTVVKSVVSIAGLVLILKYEESDIITTKGLDFIKRLLP